MLTTGYQPRSESQHGSSFNGASEAVRATPQGILPKFLDNLNAKGEEVCLCQHKTLVDLKSRFPLRKRGAVSKVVVMFPLSGPVKVLESKRFGLMSCLR